jgi:hypothetical protein
MRILAAVGAVLFGAGSAAAVDDANPLMAPATWEGTARPRPSRHRDTEDGAVILELGDRGLRRLHCRGHRFAATVPAGARGAAATRTPPPRDDHADSASDAPEPAARPRQ